MLIRESRVADPAKMRRAAAACERDAELFVRDDGAGGVMLCAVNAANRDNNFTDRHVDLRFSGGRHGREGGDWLFQVGLWTPADFRGEFLAWYEIEHLPILLECAEWDGCRFFEEKVERGAQFHAFHQLADRSALDSAERLHSRSTPWFKRLSENAWFDGAFTRTLCRRIPA